MAVGWCTGVRGRGRGLVGMDYHFVGDVVAGGFVGGIVGAYTAHFAGLGGPHRLAPNLAPADS